MMLSVGKYMKERIYIFAHLFSMIIVTSEREKIFGTIHISIANMVHFLAKSTRKKYF